MIFQSSKVKTELIYVFEFSIQFLNIPFEHSNNQFGTLPYVGARVVCFHYKAASIDGL